MELRGRRLAQSLECRHCGFDLKGVQLDGRCPECGQPVWPSVLLWLDPERDRLPMLDHPHRVARRLVLMADGFTLLAILSALALAWHAASQITFGISLLSMMRMVGSCSEIGITAVPVLMVLCSIGIGQDQYPLGWPLRIFRLGLLGIALGNALGIPALAAVALAMALLGFRSCVRSIGARSRAFREAGPERQRLLEMALVSLMLAGGLLLEAWRRGADGWPWAPGVSTVLLTVSSGFLVVGFLYFRRNVRWISESLCGPSPRLRTLLWAEDDDLLRGWGRF
ncbi:MAG: hypothetical protein CMJ30_01240 [Phycisphaerae bacterium]|nr:hypothetical protein [Phycisphaerae bacterium]